MGAALLGLAAGLMIVVPTVLWMSGWLEPRKASPARHAMCLPPRPPHLDLKSAEVRTMKVQVLPTGEAGRSRGSVCHRQHRADGRRSRCPNARRSEPLRRRRPWSAKLADAQAAEARQAPSVVDTARPGLAARRERRRDGAREMLAAAEEGSEDPAVFALAETYDPNMLAAWGSRGVAADVAKARALYRKALNLGVANAQNRLEALK